MHPEVGLDAGKWLEKAVEGGVWFWHDNIGWFWTRWHLPAEDSSDLSEFAGLLNFAISEYLMLMCN